MVLLSISAVSTLKFSGFVNLQATLSISPTTPGNLLVFSCYTTTSSGSPSVSNVSGGGVSTWFESLLSAQFTTPPANQRGTIWLGTAKTTGASTVTITSSTGSFAGSNGLFCQEFTANAGPNTRWYVDPGQTGTRTNASSATITFPTLVPSGPNRLYVGPGYAGGTGNTSGATAGYTVQLDTNNNPFIYNTNVSTSQSPTSQQTTSTSDAMGILIFAVDPAPGSKSTQNHPGKGPGTSRFNTTPRSTNAPLADFTYAGQLIPYY